MRKIHIVFRAKNVKNANNYISFNVLKRVDS